MTRKIKFRAWNKVWGMMSLVDKIEFEEGKPVSVSVTIKATDFDHTDEWSDYEVGDDIILQQYTGLKDKNGKEIYEGDIIQTDVNLKKWIVYEEDYAWYVKNIGSNEKYPLGVYKKLISVASSKLEVIGNIYQNKTLLNI